MVMKMVVMLLVMVMMPLKITVVFVTIVASSLLPLLFVISILAVSSVIQTYCHTFGQFLPRSAAISLFATLKVMVVRNFNRARVRLDPQVHQDVWRRLHQRQLRGETPHG